LGCTYNLNEKVNCRAHVHADMSQDKTWYYTTEEPVYYHDEKVDIPSETNNFENNSLQYHFNLVFY